MHSPECILCRLRRNCPFLTTLDTSGRGLCLRELKQLIAALKKNTHLTSLDLRHNHITEEGAILLAEMLREDSCSLETLRLEGNPIGDAGARALGRIMEEKPIRLSILSNFILIAGSMGIVQVRA
jgi:Ran GTPase-activating protein (RanGAP) involved in mRNA processing and transport